jgi:thiol-disulfide isomerase/thioredoxin
MNPPEPHPPSALPNESSRRRQWLALAAVGGIAGAAGAGWGWWRQHSAGADPTQRLPEMAADATAQAGASFWTLRFEQPAGGELATASLRGRPLLVNFWATWCPPCIKEMPLLDQFARAQAVKGWQVLGLAVDSPSPVRSFLQRQPMSFPIGLAGMDGVELAKSLGNAGGQLPYSVVFDRDGRFRHRKLGVVDAALLADWVKDLA